MDPQELEPGDMLNSRPVDVDGVVIIHIELFGLAGVEEQVIFSAPRGQVLYLFSVGFLIVVADEICHYGIVANLMIASDP